MSKEDDQIILVGDYQLTWVSPDTLQIMHLKWKRCVYIDGGDFESLLSALMTIRGRP